MAELQEPDRALRRQVLERHVAQQQLTVEPMLLDYLADRPVESVRALAGLLQRVVSAAAAQDLPPTAAIAREVLEGQPVKARRTAGFRTSGIVVSSAGGIRSREKMVWEWPDPSDRVIEELR